MNDTTRSLAELAVMLSGAGGSVSLLVTAFTWPDVKGDLAGLKADLVKLPGRMTYPRYARHRADRHYPRHADDSVMAVA